MAEDDLDYSARKSAPVIVLCRQRQCDSLMI